MLQRTFSPQNRRFTIFALGLIPMFLCMLVLVGAAASQIWEHEQEIRRQRKEFEREYDLWRTQDIANYTVTYSNSSVPQCQNVAMVVENNYIASTTPVCNTSYYYGYSLVRPMDDLFVWMDTNAFDDYYDKVEIEYHPHFHYVTRLVIDDKYSASTVEILYEDLRAND